MKSNPKSSKYPTLFSNLCCTLLKHVNIISCMCRCSTEGRITGLYKRGTACGAHCECSGDPVLRQPVVTGEMALKLVKVPHL